MEIQELRIFCAIIDQGSFKNAGSHLGLSQPAISQSLANLERKLGEKLLNRTVPIQPTAIGLELLKHARFIIESEGFFNNQLAKMKHGHLQTLTLAVDHMAANYYSPKIITEFHKTLPEADFKITRMPAREIINAVKSQQYQIGIGPFQKGMEGLHAIELMTEESHLITGKNNPLLKIYAHNPLEFLKQTILLTSYLDDPDERPSKKKIRDYFKTAWQVNDINLQLALIKQGIGATFIAKPFLTSDEAKSQFVVLDKIPFALIKKQYGVYILDKNLTVDSISKFIILMQKISFKI
ncbi:MAG: LysR family transcriptional regulator [Alphaproteobacteria bacterium]|nr:LysR family transcriptional regulator [Alphaproteobacteria bacterium]